METKDKIIKTLFGISELAPDSAILDKGECKKAMEEYHQSQSKQMQQRIKELEGVLKIAFQLLDTREIPAQTELNILKIDLITALNNKQK
jgi:hypothetical protein